MQTILNYMLSSCLPSLIFASSTVQSTTFNLHLTKIDFSLTNSNTLLKTPHKGDPEYNQLLKKLPICHIKKTFLDKHRVRKDLIIFKTNKTSSSYAAGTNMFRNSSAAIFLNKDLIDADKQASYWMTKHEISHIKNNDTFSIPLASLISTNAAAIFATLSMPLLPAILLTSGVSLATFSLFAQWREKKADDFAIENSSNKELLGGRRLLIATKEANLEQRKKTFWEKIKISAYGESRFDITHPSLASRIQKIEKVLEKKGISINNKIENKKIKDLKKTILDIRSESEEERANNSWFF